MNDWVKAETDLIKKLKGLVDKHGLVDVGRGVAEMLGVSQTRLDAALVKLQASGYLVLGGILPHATSDKKLRLPTIKVLCKPGTDRADIFTDKVYHLAGGEIK